MPLAVSIILDMYVSSTSNGIAVQTFFCDFYTRKTKNLPPHQKIEKK